VIATRIHVEQRAQKYSQSRTWKISAESSGIRYLVPWTGYRVSLIRDFCLSRPYAGCSTPFQYLLFSRGWAVKALSAIGLHGNGALLKVGPGAFGLGPVPTLLTGLYAAAAVRHVRKH
jgi:hypothetical protein